MSVAETMYNGYEKILEPTEEELKRERARAIRLNVANVARRIGQGVCILGAAATTATALAIPEPFSKAVILGASVALGRGALKLEHGVRKAEVALGRRDSTDNRLTSFLYKGDSVRRDKMQEFGRSVSKIASIALTATAMAAPVTAPIALGIAAASAINSYRLKKQIDDRVVNPNRSDYSPSVGQTKQDKRWERAMAKSQSKFKTVKTFDDAATRAEKFNRFCEQGTALLAKGALDKMAKMGIIDSQTMISILTSSAPLTQQINNIAANVTEDKLPKLQKIQQWYAKKDKKFAQQINKMYNIDDMQNASMLNMGGLLDTLIQRPLAVPPNAVPLSQTANEVYRENTTARAETVAQPETAANEVVSNLAKNNSEPLQTPNNAEVSVKKDEISFDYNGVYNFKAQTNGMLKMDYVPVNDGERNAIVERLKSTNPDLPKNFTGDTFKNGDAKIEVYQLSGMTMATVYLANGKDVNLRLNEKETNALNGAIAQKASEADKAKTQTVQKSKGNEVVG